VLLLDEPFSNLDAKLRERARAWVKELQHKLDLTTIFVTHDQDEALSMSDRIAVMSAGRIQQIGTPEEVYRRPANRFVAEFVGRVNLLAGRVASNDGGTVVIDVADSRHRLTLAAPDETGLAANVTVAIRPEAVTLVQNGQTNGTNTWDADVQRVAFLGDHYEYELNAGSIPLLVQSSRRVDGDKIRVHIPADAVAVLE
jgi:iron(III) transport system ATP-binding protein